MRYLAVREFKIIKELKSANIIEAELNFQYLYEDVKKDGGRFTYWSTNLPVPSMLIPPEDLEITSPAYVNPGDGIQISWNPEFNPMEFNEQIELLIGEVKTVVHGTVHAVFKIKHGLWPPDAILPEWPANIKPPKRITYKICFLPNPSIYERRMEALEKIEFLPQIIQNVLIGKLPGPPNTKGENINLDFITLNPSQEKAATAASTNCLTVIQGPPGCGKTHTIGAIAVACIKKNRGKKVMICGTTNVSINSLLEICGKIITKERYKVCWPAARSRDFDSDENLTEQQKYMTFYQIMHLNTPESKEFYDIQK